MRKRWIRYILITLALSIICHLLVVYFLPRILMIAAALRIKGDFGVGKNELLHSEPVTAETRRIVMPSPDLLYSEISFDVGQCPLLIEASLPANTYWSVSMYDYDTNNFFVIDDRDIPTKGLAVVLIGPDGTAPKREGALVVRAPGDQGIILFRMFVADRDRIGELQGYQKRIRCTTLK